MKVVEEPAVSEKMRIAKAMARAGLCSRRDAERWILEGRVSVNGATIKSPALDVGPSDTIKVDGQALTKPEPAMLWRFHKPRGCVTTHRDPEGRPTVFEKLPKDMPRVISIGRLDFNTEGLLLLTTDGGLARHFELPATGWLRRYRVRANGTVTQEQLDALKDGVEIEGVKYGPIEGTVDRVQNANVWLTLGLREGKNREVRKILGSLGLEVNRLIRISFGPFQLLDLEEGTVERVKRRVLADQLGPALAAEYGLDVIQVDERPGKNTGYQARKPLVDPDEAEQKSGPKQRGGPRQKVGEKKPFTKRPFGKSPDESTDRRSERRPDRQQERMPDRRPSRQDDRRDDRRPNQRDDRQDQATRPERPKTGYQLKPGFGKANAPAPTVERAAPASDKRPAKPTSGFKARPRR